MWRATSAGPWVPEFLKKTVTPQAVQAYTLSTAKQAMNTSTRAIEAYRLKYVDIPEGRVSHCCPSLRVASSVPSPLLSASAHHPPLASLLATANVLCTSSPSPFLPPLLPNPSSPSPPCTLPYTAASMHPSPPSIHLHFPSLSPLNPHLTSLPPAPTSYSCSSPPPLAPIPPDRPPPPRAHPATHKSA